MSNKKWLVVFGIGVLVTTITTFIILIRKKNINKVNNKIIKNEYDVILMGGLDTRKGDKNIEEQVNLLKKNTNKKNIIGFRYNDILGVKKILEKYPNIIVVLFSSGASYSSTISKLMTYKNKLFIVEPYASSSNVKKSVKDALSMGVPNKNLITGNSSSRGNGIIEQSTKTPKGLGHWEALEFVGNLI